MSSSRSPDCRLLRPNFAMVSVDWKVLTKSLRRQAWEAHSTNFWGSHIFSSQNQPQNTHHTTQTTNLSLSHITRIVTLATLEYFNLLLSTSRMDRKKKNDSIVAYSTLFPWHDAWRGHGLDWQQRPASPRSLVDQIPVYLSLQLNILLVSLIILSFLPLYAAIPVEVSKAPCPPGGFHGVGLGEVGLSQEQTFPHGRY